MRSGNGASAQSATSKTHALAVWVSVYLAEGGQMLVAYLDEVVEAGAFVSKTHKNYNGSGLRVKMCVWLGVSRGLDLAFLNAD